MRRGKLTIILVIIVVFLSSVIFVLDRYGADVKHFINIVINHAPKIRVVKVPAEYSKVDNNKNGVPDCIDIVTEARKEAINKTKYKDVYYVGGYPPDNEGVCTDVIWRGLKGIGVDLKSAIDKDIKNNLSAYPRVEKKPDPNIDFRRVQNLDVFLKRNAESVTKEIKPYDIDNLKQWQPGDILIIMKPFEHVAFISDKRDDSGVPLIIHNTSPHAVENNRLADWAPYIYGHYRWKY